MMMKKATLLLMLVIATPSVSATDIFSENKMIPPPGPYHSSTEKESHKVDNKAQMRPQYQPRQLNNEIPEWVRQQQAQMQQWMRQNSGQFSRPPVQRWNSQIPARPYFQQGSNYHGNRMQPYSPYGNAPYMKPPTFNQQRR